MTYDRDLRQVRLVLWFLVAINLGNAYLNARAHHWLFVVACLIWTANLLIYLFGMRIQQRTRDEIRLVVSMIHAAAAQEESKD